MTHLDPRGDGHLKRAHPARLAGCALALLALLPWHVAASPPLAISTDDGPPYSTEERSGVCDRIVAEAFRRVGVPVTLLRLPSERALIRADQGTDDGNYSRVEGLEGQYVNLVRVPEEIARFVFVAFTDRADVAARDWASLGPYRVGVITGWKILEANAAGARSVTKATDEGGLFRLLGAGRVDVALYERAQGLFYLGRHGGGGVRPLAPPLAERPMYLYLNRRHEALVGPLSRALGAMRHEGVLARLRREALRGLGMPPDG